MAIKGHPASKQIELGEAIRSEFPIFSGVRERRLSFLDSAASSQKPRIVIDRLTNYLSFEHANIHRGAYELSATATENYENSRKKIEQFIGCEEDGVVVFTRGTTESINLVARSLERELGPNDTILLTQLEHHSNIVPWQLAAARCGAKIEFAKINQDATINEADFFEKIQKFRPRIVSFVHVSNAFGTVLPIERYIAEAKACGALTLIDAAQSVPHRALSVAELGADFVAFSAHKMYGPTGVGALYAKRALLDIMEPYQGGGEMISRVTTTGSTWAEVPHKFEAGTPPIAEAIAFGTAVEFIESIGIERIAAHEERMVEYAIESLRQEPGVTLYGPTTSGKPQSAIVSFNVSGVHAHDFSTIADHFNVQVRAGHHCAMPALAQLGIHASVRASFGVYSCTEDVDALIEAVRQAKKLFS